MMRPPKLLELNAFSITVFYLIFALLWILLSDQLLIWITNDPILISRYQTLKGILYVLVTAVFLFFLITKSNEKISDRKGRIDNALYAAGMATWSVNLKTKNIRRSKFHYKIFGLKKNPTTWTINDFYDSIHPEDRERVREVLERTIQQDLSSYQVKFRIYTADGDLRWMQSRGNLVYEGPNELVQLAGVVADITEQKKLEEDYAREKELFENIFENIPVMVDIYDPEINEIRVNKAFENYLGWSNEEIQEIDLLKACYPDPDMRAKAVKGMNEADGQWQEVEVMSKAGEKRIQSWCNTRLSDDTTIGIGLDITELKASQAEIKESRELLKRTFESIPESIIILDPETRTIIDCNQSTCEIFGYSRDELIGRSIRKLHVNDTKFKEFGRIIEEVLDQRDFFTTEFVLQKKNGNKFFSELMVSEVKNERGEVEKIVKVVRDITEAKLSQAKIKESRELLEKTFESLNESVIILDPETRTITDCNKATGELFGYSEDELIGNSTKILHIDQSHFKEFSKLGAEDLEQKGVFRTEFKLKKKDGTEFHSDHTVTLVENEEGQIEKVVSVIRDITERKKHEKKLQNLTERYRNAEKIAHIGHWKRNIITDEDTNEVLDKAIWSDGVYDILGLEKGAKKPSYEGFLEMIHPDDREEFDTAIKKAIETGSLNIRYRLIKPGTGEIGYYQGLAQTEYDEEGNPVAISGTIQDMTEQEEFQIKLKQRNDFIETTLENLPVGIAVNLMDSGEATLMNSKFSEIYGWPKDIITNVESFFKNVYPDENYRKKIVEMISADIASEKIDRMQWSGIKITTQSGEERIVNAKNIPVYEQNLMISTVVDVTAQFKAEQRLAESEHNYRMLFLNNPLPMWITNPETLEIVEVNNASLEHYGYTRKEFQEMTILGLLPDQDIPSAQKFLQSKPFEGPAEWGEWRHQKKSGELMYVHTTGSKINYFGKQYWLVLINDITEQKITEERVLASLVKGENKERARIARELHDGLGQYLAAANMNLDAIQSDINKLSERRQQQFEKGLTLLKHAVTETAQISRNLLPRVVDDYGLALAIEALVDNYSSNTETKIKYFQNIKDLELPYEIEFNLYRIAQEGISNAVKYAQASQINVQLIKDGLDLILTIDDNGRGFDTSRKDFTPGLGLQTIKTRAGALGGEFEFDSKPGKGTLLTIIVPLKN